MSFYLTILGTRDNPLFTHTFGTSKQGGDGQPRFLPAGTGNNPITQNAFIAHAALDILEDIQWSSASASGSGGSGGSGGSSSSSATQGHGGMYLRTIDRHYTMGSAGAGTASHVAAFVTATNIKFLLVSQALSPAAAGAASGNGGGGGDVTEKRVTRAFVNYNATSAETEEAIKKFFLDVYDVWLKTAMNPFYQLNDPITSPVFRARVMAAAKKHL